MNTYLASATGGASEGSLRSETLSPILIGDQDVRIRQLVGIALSDSPSTPAGAATGEKILKLANRRVFNLVFLRLDLPDIDGLEIIRRLRRSGNLEPVVLHYGALRPAGILRALRLGVIGLLERPFSLSQIRRFVGKRLVPYRPTPAERAMRLAEHGRFRHAAMELERATFPSPSAISRTWISLLRGLGEQAGDARLLPLVGGLISPTSGLHYPAGTRFHP